MKARTNWLKVWISRLWHADRPLTATGLLMLAALVTSLVGLAIDPRTITSVPAWLKPAKFAVSIAIYSLTLAWIFRYLPAWPKTRRVVGWTTAVALVLELVIIDVQAWRGTTSHFNVGTPLDMVLWSTMGFAIVAQTLTSIAVAIALWRQPFTDRALGWALRFGIVITIVGASAGGLMTGPTAAQLEQARAGTRMTVVGAHTVGAPDGGPGLPGTGWSRQHGDLRVAHFLGLHAMQALPLMTVLLRRRRWPEATRVRLTVVAAASYAMLFALLLGQALRGQSALQPDGTTLLAFAVWIAVAAASAWIAVARPHALAAVAV